MKNQSMLSRSKGFTLIEMLIVVVIIGILAAIAIPAYQDYIIRSRLPEAFSLLDGARVKMEQHYGDVRSYATKRGGSECPTTKINAGSKFFDLTFEGNCSDTVYKLKASGKNGMEAFVYTLDNTGQRVTVSMNTTWTNASTPALKCKNDSDKDGWIAKKGGICY